MRKIIIAGFLLAFGAANGLFGQESAKNTLSAGINLSGIFPAFPGINVGYERLLTKHFSVAFDMGVDTVIFPYAEVSGRWYPWEGSFFAHLGLGVWSLLPIIGLIGPQLVVSPGIGWKIDIGEKNGWFLIPNLTGKIIIYNSQFVLPITEINFSFGYSF
jgi:hypothetical protein